MESIRECLDELSDYVDDVIAVINGQFGEDPDRDEIIEALIDCLDEVFILIEEAKDIAYVEEEEEEE